jgi:hypothetical protein
VMPVPKPIMFQPVRFVSKPGFFTVAPWRHVCGVLPAPRRPIRHKAECANHLVRRS